MKFKKITAVIASTLMAGMTVGMAAAANYPAPFVENGVANVAVVYGTGAGVSSLDQVQAGNIQTSLASFVSGSTTTATGESYKIERSSNRLYFDKSFTDIVTSGVLRDSEMEDFLADGIYLDSNNDEVDYNQEITLGDNSLTYFSDRNYEDKEPTLGFEYEKNDAVLNYTITFEEGLSDEDIAETDMTILGKEYYVLESDLSATDPTITLLDTSSTTVIAEGESATIDGKTISVDFIGAATTSAGSDVKLSVDGEVLKSLRAGDTYKLTDGSVVAIKEVLYSSKESGISRAEVTVGSGKLILTDGDEVDLNGEDVDGLYAHVSNSTDLIITLEWIADEDLFLTPENELLMPGFEAVKLSMGEIDFPNPSKVILEGGEDEFSLIAPIEKGTIDLPLFYKNASDDFELGKATDEVLSTAFETTNETTVDILKLNISEETMFVATYVGSNGNTAYSYAYQFDSIKETSGKTVVKLAGLAGESAIEFSDVNRSVYVKDMTFTLRHSVEGEEENVTTDVDEGVAYIEIGGTSGTVYVDKLVTKDGLVMGLPTAAILDGNSWDMPFWEEDQDEYVNTTLSDAGTSFNVTIKGVSTGEIEVDSTDTFVTQSNPDDSKITYGYIMSPLATMMTLDKTGSVNEFVIEYYNQDIPLDVFVSEAGASITSTGALGDILVRDSEIDSVRSKNLVIVGGSCINSAAATVLGGAYCGEAFTSATGVGPGEFLIKGVQDAYTNGRIALVVAGYEAADTANAATYLTRRDVDTSMSYKGTSATEATMITTTA